MAVGKTVDVPGIGEVKAVYVYGIGAVFVGVIGYAWWSRRNLAAGSEAEPAYVPGMDEDSGGTTTAGIERRDPEPVDPDKLPPTTNDEWSRRATEYMMNVLGYDGQLVAKTIGKYLSRQGLTPNEQDIIRTIWGQLGRPPQGDFPILSVPKPKPDPKPDPKPKPVESGVYVTVVRYTTRNPPWNSTISGIAARYGWGNNWGVVWNHAKNASLRARRREPRYIQPGDRVWVPKK